MTLKDVTSFILTSDLTDADFARISEAMKQARKIAGQKLKFSLQVGDIVFLKDTAKPTYIAGAKAIVTKINREKVVIDLDKPAGRFHRNINCPLSLLTTEAS